MKFAIVFVLVSVFCPSLTKALELDDLIRYPEYQTVRISPDGKYLAVKALKGSEYVLIFLNLKSLKVTSILRFQGREEVGSFRWVNNERVVTEIWTRHGWLDQPIDYGVLYGTNYDGSKSGLVFGRIAGKDLASLRGKKRRDRAHASIIDVLPDDPENVLVDTRPWSNKGTFERRGAIYKLNVYTGIRHKIISLPQIYGHGYSDNNSEVRFATGTDKENHGQLYRKTKEGEWEIIEQANNSKFVSVPVGFSKNNDAVFLASSQGSDLKGLYRLDLETLERKLVYRDLRVDITSGDVIHSPENRSVVGVYFEPAYPEYKFWNEKGQFESFYLSLVQAFKGDRVGFYSFTKDGKKGIVFVSGDTNPGTYYLADIEKREVKFLLDSASWINKEKLVKQEAFSIKSADGFVLNGYISMPPGKKTGLPMIVVPHGGPYSRDYWGYDSESQILARAGYVVLAVNFRGSSGYGHRFKQAADGHWGTKVQDDIAVATNWAISEKIADPERVCIYGASFGGYSALMSAIRYPNLYQCAAGYAGIYDLEMLYTQGDIQRTQRGEAYLENSIGNEKEDLRSQSPVYLADRIRIPIFLAHGKLDDRAPVAHARKMLEALKINKIPHKWLLERKEAHGFSDVEARRRLYQGLLEFFDDHTGA